MSREEMDMLQRRAERDRRAREQAERLLEEKSRDLYDTNERLRLATRGRLEALGRVGEDLSQLQDLDLLMSPSFPRRARSPAPRRARCS